jgi:hypothetical protein
MSLRRLLVLVCTGLFCSFSVVAFAQTATDEFTIIALSDTQFYSSDNPQIFAAQTNWIAQHAIDQNIRLVVGLGDIVNGGGELNQWRNADAAARALEERVPYMFAIGNHDYDQNNPAGRTAAAQNFNTYFGPQRYASASWYRGSFPQGSNENFYGVINVNGKDYLVLILEFAPRDSALNWAAGVVAANPDKEIIIVTHMFTFADNTRISQCDENSAESFGVGQDNNGDDMWWKFVRNYPNIHLVLSGHVVQGDGTGRRMDLGANGNLVNQILSDYQSEPLGGGGFLRIMKISPSLNRVRVTTYSPYLDQYKTDDHNAFTVPYHNPGIMSAPGNISGKVKNALDCSPMSGVLISNGAASTISDTNGNYTFPALARKSYSISATRTGWLSNAQTATATISPMAEPSPAKIFVSTAGRIHGMVQNASGTPIPNANVIITGGKLRTTKTVRTASDGGFDSNWTSIGSYVVTVSASGFITQSLETRVDVGLTTTMNISLQK